MILMAFCGPAMAIMVQIRDCAKLQQPVDANNIQTSQRGTAKIVRGATRYHGKSKTNQNTHTLRNIFSKSAQEGWHRNQQ